MTFTTTKDYQTTKFGFTFIVPKGSKATNQTACGIDDTIRFWNDFQAVAKEVTGFENSILAHDLKHYGLDIPKEYFE